jgi:Helix-turn-helix domain
MHPSPQAGTTQCDRILHELTANAGKWVSLLRLYRVSRSMAVHSRINDLRQRGHRIEQQSKHVRKMIHSSYRLL